MFLLRTSFCYKITRLGPYTTLLLTSFCYKITRLGPFYQVELSLFISLFISQLIDEAASDAEDVNLLILASQWDGAIPGRIISQFVLFSPL